MFNEKEKKAIRVLVIILCSCIVIVGIVFASQYFGNGIATSKNVKSKNKLELVSDGVIVEELTVLDGESLNLPNLTKSGYEFLGWYLDEEYTTEYKTGNAIGSDITIYAKWDKNSYQITANPNYVGGGANKVYYFGYSDAVNISAPVRKGYKFTGWYLDDKCTKPLDITAMPDYSFNVYANWVKNSFTIKFNTLLPDTDGIETPDSRTYYYDDLIETLPDFTDAREGYTFDGWYTETSYKNEVIDGSHMGDNNITLFAKWTIKQYDIVFDTQGGSEVEAITADYNSVVEAPEAPTKAGYDFVGWYVSALPESEAYEFTTMPLDGATIYAKWEARTDTAYTIQHIAVIADEEVLIEEEYGTGTTGETKTVVEKTYEDYVFFITYPFNDMSKIIEGDGSTVFKIYYEAK